ncbi:TonB-dependent receptor [Sphingobium limneticum]|uniref:TonB-dependent receptor n=1 Tax=Sphingobium limneticum TaxID=1007511 RepID=UPI00123D4886|nr:TonB-dependent receptor [Sphingobium limneticum]KAA9014763.1 TonB-dependent receptor [Sphingobium limneticum]
MLFNHTRGIRRMPTATAFAALFLAVAAAPAYAAEGDVAEADASAGQLDEIVVTAEKRPQSLQTTPISISVMRSDDLVNRHVQSLTDLGDGAIPSLRVAPFFSRPGALIVNVRGVGVLSDSNQPARDQGVGVYIDGVYMGRPQGLGAALYDIENIEVLKGPQGTLFGRNTEGGAVNIVTKRPSGQFKMNTTFGAGNFGSYKAETHIDLPEFNNISIKLDGVVSHRDGTVKNPLKSQSDFNGYTKRGVHGEIMWKPSSDFTVDLAADTSYDASTTLYQQQISAGTNKLAAAAKLQPHRAKEAVVGTIEQPSIGKSTGVRLNLEWQAADSLMLKSISSYRKLTQSQFDNASVATSMQQPITAANPTGAFNLPSTVTTAGTGFVTNYPGFAFGRYSLAYFKQNQISQELQAIGDFGDQFKYAVGALYYREKVSDNAQAYNTNYFLNAAGSAYGMLNIDPATRNIDRASHVTTTSIGAYGQATYTPSFANDIVHLTGGLRWTRDKKVGALTIVNNVAPILPVNGVNVQGPIALDAHWSRVDPMVNLAFDVTDDVHVYGKWSTGYKSGGANSRATNYKPFNPETVSMFEIGAKTEFWDHRARFNIAAYTGTYKNIQLDFSGLYEDVVNGVRVVTTRTTTNTVNDTGKGKLKGVEAEFTLAPVNGLTLSASYAYNSVKIPDALNPFPVAGNNGQASKFPVPIYQVYTPEHSASGAIDYEVPLNDYTLRFHIDGNYDSGYYGAYTDPGFNALTGVVTYKQPKGEAGLVFNGRIAVADIALGNSGAKMTVSAWARNLFNEEHVFLKSAAATTGVAGFFNEARTFDGELNMKF